MNIKFTALLFLLLISSSSFSDVSFLEISKNDNEGDVLCVTNDEIEKNFRIKQLVRIIKNIEENLEIGIRDEFKFPEYSGDCFILSNFPIEYKKIPFEIIDILSNKLNHDLEKSAVLEVDIKISKDEKTKFQKFLKAEAYMTGLQIVSMSYLLLLPRNFTKWDEGGLWKKMPAKLKEAWTKPPKWDSDPWPVNFVSHPHSGSIYYNFMRSNGFSISESFGYAIYKSAFWEYIIEATVERPSIQDLIFTPVGGLIMGEGVNILTNKMKKNGFNFFEKVFITFMNPSYAINHGYK